MPPSTGGTTVRHGPNLTPRGALERSESRGIWACQGSKDSSPVTVRALSPDRGSLRRQRTGQHERRTTTSDGEVRSDHAGAPRYSENANSKIVTVKMKTRKLYHTSKARRSDEVIYNTRLGNVYLINDHNYSAKNSTIRSEVSDLTNYILSAMKQRKPPGAKTTGNVNGDEDGGIGVKVVDTKERGRFGDQGWVSSKTFRVLCSWFRLVSQNGLGSSLAGVGEEDGDRTRRIRIKCRYNTVSYTHLTLPTTPYV